MIRLLIPGLAALFAMIAASQVFTKIETVGVMKERARTETAERKVDEKIVKARRAAAARPAASVLDRWSAD
jgi:hypothetical protein